MRIKEKYLHKLNQAYIQVENIILKMNFYNLAYFIKIIIIEIWITFPKFAEQRKSDLLHPFEVETHSLATILTWEETTQTITSIRGMNLTNPLWAFEKNDL